MATTHHIDYITYLGASGWVFGEFGTVSRVKAICNGEKLAETSTLNLRPDVGALFPSSPGAQQSGFFLSFDQTRLDQKSVSAVQIFAECGADEILIGESFVADPERFEENLKRGRAAGRTALPLGVANSVYASGENCELNIDNVCKILRSPDLRSIREISNYARYIGSCWSHFNFVARFFPIANRDAKVGDKDYLCKLNSAIEMMSIAHHLYVLKSYGVNGALAEFGCFKGFSASMLSFACSLLGIEMHVYDSFEGLPRSASTFYKKGDFAGSAEEVRGNISQFGVIEPVVFHRGFFSDSLKKELPPPLIVLWMDVDLASSATDLIPAMEMLSPMGAIFSHESNPENFTAGGPIPGHGGPSDVVSPILSYYKRAPSGAAGLFVAGDTGAFWRAEEGIPVLPTDQLRQVLQMV